MKKEANGGRGPLYSDLCTMRIRRKPWARPELAACEFFVDDPALNKGNWHNLFGKKQPVYLELGCGKGSFIAEIASKNLDKNFIAVDIKSEVLALAKRNVEWQYSALNRPIDNLFLTAQNIERIDDILSESDVISQIYINFCNPWPKPRHKKRRLTHPRQLEKYKKFLAPGGEIYFKTDDDGLFYESITYFKESGFEIIYVTEDLLNSGFDGNISTEHEKMFCEMGKKIKFLIARLCHGE